MKRFTLISLTLLVLQLCTFSGSSANPSLSSTSTVDNSWQLVFSDEFDGTYLDTSKWNTEYWPGVPNTGNNELEYYASDAFEQGNGILRIKAEKRQMAGFDYTSGIIQSRDKFSLTYGRIEIRARIPKGKGLWPGFWLLPVSKEWPPEIDIFEALGHETNTIYMTNHWKSPAGENKSLTQYYVGPDYSQDFHTFAIEWKPSEVIWYIDGAERARTEQSVSNEAMYILANLAVGGNWPGNPDASTPFPSYYDIDYIRVYQRAYPYKSYLPSISYTG